MVDTVTLPFGALDTLPGFGSVEDVVIDIPQLPDLERIIQREVLDRSQIDEAIAEALFGTRNVEGPLLDALVRNIEDQLNIDFPGSGPIADQVVRDLEDQLNIDIPDVPSLDEIDTLLQNQLPDDLAADVIENAEVNIDGIFGPLSEDVEEALGDLIDFDLNDLPSIEDIEEAIGEELGRQLDGLSPDINGVEFWRDPLAFGEEAWTETRTLVLSEEAREELLDVLEAEN